MNGSPASFRLKLSPETAKFTPNVSHQADSVLMDTSGTGATPYSMNINGMSCAYKVFQHVGVSADNQEIWYKRWQIDVPGFSHVNNLNVEPPTRRERDVKNCSSAGPPRVELHTKNLTKKNSDGVWTNVTKEEKPPMLTKDCITFYSGFGFNPKIDVQQSEGRLTFEIHTTDEDSD